MTALLHLMQPKLLNKWEIYITKLRKCTSLFHKIFVIIRTMQYSEIKLTSQYLHRAQKAQNFEVKIEKFDG